MASNSIPGSTSHSSREWKMAWDAVARLAVAREDVLRGARHDDPSVKPLEAVNGMASDQMGAGEPLRAIDSEEYARAIADIERAAAALQRAEPALEVWKPETAAVVEPSKSWSVWIMV